MSEPTYTIKPLEWREVSDEKFEAECSLGTYVVEFGKFIQIWQWHVETGLSGTISHFRPAYTCGMHGQHSKPDSHDKRKWMLTKEEAIADAEDHYARTIMAAIEQLTPCKETT